MQKMAGFLGLGLFMAANAWALKEDDKTLYALGAAVAQRLQPFELSKDEISVVEDGFQDALRGKKLEVDPKDFGQKIQTLAQARDEKRTARDLTKNKEEAKKYIEKLATDSQEKKYPSGLWMRSLKEGTGASPKATDTVKVHYTGTFIDGNIFDNSRTRNEPAQFPLNGVIPCWTEALQHMKVGGRAKLVCPSDIAYGDRGRPPVIGAGQLLVFDVELLEVSKGKGKPAAKAAAAPSKKENKPVDKPKAK